MKLSIIFPAYNEEARILPVLNSYYSFFKNRLRGDFEIIVIPNNCSDNTVEIVKEFCSKRKEADYFEIKEYLGKGGSVMKGFGLAKGEFIGFVDSDKSTSVVEFFKLYNNIGKSDGIIGSRRMKESRVIPKRSFGKKVNSLGFNFVVSLLFGLGYKDTQCGAKIFRKKVAKYLVKNFKEVGWIFDVDLLMLCKRKGYKIREFPILWEEGEGSHISNWEGVKSVFRLIRYRFIF